MARPARSAARRSRPTVSTSKSRRVSVPTWIEPTTASPSSSGTASSELIAGPSELASSSALATSAIVTGPRWRRDAFDDAVDRGRRLALDGRVHAARRARDDRARLVGQHGGGTVDVERLEDAVQQLAQQLLQALGAERGGGDRLHDLQALGGGLGVRARRLRADELLAVALGAAALAQVLQLQDEVGPARR